MQKLHFSNPQKQNTYSVPPKSQSYFVPEEEAYSVSDIMQAVEAELPSIHNCHNLEHNLSVAFQICNDPKNLTLQDPQKGFLGFVEEKRNGIVFYTIRVGNCQVRFNTNKNTYEIFLSDMHHSSTPEKERLNGGTLHVKPNVFLIYYDPSHKNVTVEHHVSLSNESPIFRKRDCADQLKVKNFTPFLKLGKSRNDMHEIFISPYEGQDLFTYFKKTSYTDFERQELEELFIKQVFQLLVLEKNRVFDIKLENTLFKIDPKTGQKKLTIIDYQDLLATLSYYPKHLREQIQQHHGSYKILKELRMRYLEIIITALYIRSGAKIRIDRMPLVELTKHLEEIKTMADKINSDPSQHTTIEDIALFKSVCDTIKNPHAKLF